MSAPDSHPAVVGWGIVQLALYFGFSLCPILLPPPCFYRCWFLINVLYPSLHFSFSFWRTQLAVVVHKYGKILEKHVDKILPPSSPALNRHQPTCSHLPGSEPSVYMQTQIPTLSPRPLRAVQVRVLLKAPFEEMSGEGWGTEIQLSLHSPNPGSWWRNELFRRRGAHSKLIPRRSVANNGQDSWLPPPGGLDSPPHILLSGLILNPFLHQEGEIQWPEDKKTRCSCQQAPFRAGSRCHSPAPTSLNHMCSAG